MATVEQDVRRKGLPPEAYERIPGDRYPPYVAPEENLAEFTFKAVGLGVLLFVVTIIVNVSARTIVGHFDRRTKGA